MSSLELKRRRRTVRLTSLDKLWWPDEGIRKGDVVAYYRSVADAIVPHLRGRPFSLKRYPEGPQGPYFWVKDAPEFMPDWIATARLPAKSRGGETVDYPVVNDELSLLWMVQMGCIDLHLWYSRVDKPSRPDYVLFDLDPSPDVGFAETVETAHLLREALDALGLKCFVKTSGGDGLHVQVPVERRYTYDETRAFAEIVADALRRARKDLVTTEWTKAKRRGVFIDAKMNGEGMTIASVYSVRPRPGAPVSTPLAWDELTPSLDPRSFTMDAVVRRVARDGDLFAPVLATRQRLDRALAAVD